MELYEIVILKYIELLNQYLQHMKQSDILKTIPNSDYIIYIGLNSILHLFKIVFNNTKNIDITFYHCQKACYCYLEYIEQMNKTFSFHNLNNLDAITFIYKNSLVEIETSKIQNSNSVNNDTIHLILKNISMITKKILFFSEEFELEETEENAILVEKQNSETNCKIIQLQFLINHFLKRFFLLTIKHHKDKSFLFEFIKNIKTTLNLNFNEYCEFLKHIYRILKKKGSIPNEIDLNEKYILYFVNQENNILMEQLKTEKKMEEIIKMVF